MLTLLLIEDNEDIRENLVEMIGSMKLFDHIWEAGTGKIAVQLATEKNPSIILCDIGLPDISGIDVFKRIKKIPELVYTPFVFLTANPLQQSECMALGCDDYIHKPYKMKNLIERLRVVILKYQGIREKAKSEALESIPGDVMVEEGLSSIKANQMLILLDEQNPPETKELAKSSLRRVAEMVGIMRAWKKANQV